MRARLVVFPIKGRNWCFSRSIEHNSVTGSLSSEVPITFRDLWKKISTSSDSKPEILIDFVANKMNRGWAAFEKAPPGSFKNKIHRLGVRLLARVKPSEIFLKSISNEDTSIVLTYPSSLNARLVRRRLRHIAFRGTIIHKNYFYGSASLLPLTTVLTILPLPNIPFFWILFRTYSHWRALKGSEKLLQLVSDQSENEKSARTENKSETLEAKSERGIHNTLGPPWVLQPSEELEKLLHGQDADNGLGQQTITDICKIFHLNTIDVLKYRDSL